MTEHDECHETVDQATRQKMLRTCKQRCQGCGRRGSGAGGVVTLEVHHLSRDPDVPMHDPENLTVLCQACHSWHHEQTSPDEVPVELSEEDVAELLPKDVEILRVLGESGPMMTGAITSAHSIEMSAATVRERLHVLMGLDNKVASRDRQLVDQDPNTGEWGLAGQITTSMRGRIPTDPQTLLQRAQDEYVRQAIERGVDRDAVMAVFDITERSTFYKANRARAYDFPLDAIDKRNGGRPATSDVI